MKTNLQRVMAAAMESEDDNLPAATDAVVAYDASEHDAAVGEVEESHREVEAAAADVETIEEVAAGLEALIASLESLEQPLSATSAVFMNIAAESHLVRLGLDMDDSPLIASFENEDNADQATKLSVNSIKTKLKAIWDAIIKAFQNIWTAIKNFFKNIIDANQHLVERGKALEASVAKVSAGTKAGAEEVELGLVKHRLQVGGKVDRIAGLADVVFLAEDLSHNAGHELANSMRLSLDVGRAKTEADVDAVISKIVEAKYTPPKTLAHREENDDKSVSYLTNELPGGVKIGVNVTDKGEGKDALEHIKKMVKSIRLENQREIKSGTEGKVPTLSLNDIHAVAKAAQVIGATGATFKATVDKMGEEIEKLGASWAEGKEDEAAAKKVTKLFSALSAYGHQCMKVAVDAAVLATRVGRGYVAYAEKSLAQYGVAEAANDDKKEDAKEEDAAKAA